MLNKLNRLSTNFEFNVTRKHGQMHQGTYFRLYILKPTNYTGPSRIGIVVTKKADKRAVIRNRIKRIYRELVRLNLGVFKENNWVAIYPRKEILEKSYEEISSDFNNTIQKISVTR